MKKFYQLLTQLPAGILSGILSLLFLTNVVHAQSSITTVYYNSYNATTATTYTGTQSPGAGLATGNYTYNFGTNVAASNNYQRLDSFIAGGLKYIFLNDTPVIKFRRVNNATVTGRRKALWFESNGVAVPTSGTGTLTPAVGLRPAYEDSLEHVFALRMYNIGIDNIFMNATTTNNNNVERMDVIFPGGLQASDASRAGFTVFDRGAGGGHDAVIIAAISTLDASGNPGSYYPAFRVLTGHYGSVASSACNYHVLRKEEGDARLRLLVPNARQQRDGVFISFTTLGVANNTRIYGYSLFGTDVNISNVANLVNYTNAANFPTNTDLGSAGGLDIVAVTGIASTSASIVILPSSAEQFSAVFDNKITRLSCTLYNTEHLQGITVERSSDGAHFTSLTTIRATGADKFVYEDAHPLPGLNYYRLLLTGKDGTATYSKIAEAHAAVKAPVWLLYPVPVKNRHFSISATGLPGTHYILKMVDLHGNLVYKQKVTGSELVQKDILLPAGTAPGMYVVYVHDAGNRCLLMRNVLVE